jgi:hypothetical protein
MLDRVMNPMQYELERAYHERCERNAAHQRQIEAAERGVAADATLLYSERAISARRLWLLLTRRQAALPGARLTV